MEQLVICGHGLAPLQGLPRPGLICHAPSWPQGILREHVLPRLEALRAPALWLHLAEQAVVFERGLAPLRGLPAAGDAADADADAPELWAPGSCLETICANPVGLRCGVPGGFGCRVRQGWPPCARPACHR